jgi:hypothetical protein
MMAMADVRRASQREVIKRFLAHTTHEWEPLEVPFELIDMSHAGAARNDNVRIWAPS